MHRKRMKGVSKTSLGMSENLEALLAYLLGWFTGIILYLIEKKSKFVRFHALQSTITFLVLGVVGLAFGTIPFIGLFFSGIVNLITIIVWVVYMIKAYEGEWFELPLFGEIAKKNVK
ncbi:MAG: DUF4870 domain-containing protein [Candidatus Aenigmatarchaeota archaeon]